MNIEVKNSIKPIDYLQSIKVLEKRAHDVFSGKKDEFSSLKNVSFCNNINNACNNADLVIIHTEWEEFKVLDFKKLSKKKKFKIFDIRNLYSVKDMKKKGFNYYSIGR